MRREFVVISIGVLVAIGAAATVAPGVLWSLVVVVPLIAIGVADMLQTRHAVRRNFPLVGNFRYLFEAIRPEINQYFVESNTDGTPFNREDRSLVYQRAKEQLDTVPFGTQVDVYRIGYEWIAHSMYAKTAPHEAPRIRIGEGQCAQPYDSSLLNISAMSFGSLSAAAVLALNGGAKRGGFAHNTGEGGISPYHEEPGGDLIWQIGTGYFGARNPDGSFSAEHFAEGANRPTVKMIELKLSQGAKPGHGGILPAAKLTPELAKIRGVPLGQDVLSPPCHTAFDGPHEMLDFVDKLRELAGGKPVGIKLCIGIHHEFLELCEAIRDSGQAPDFIAIDGGEGGTGAAPLEFSNSVGSPMVDGLLFAHRALQAYGVRSRLKLAASGKITTGFHLARALALGADIAYSARAMMLALGCIQARRCNSNHCPVGVATQNPQLTVGLDPHSKAERVYRYQEATIEALLELLAAAGIKHPDDLRPYHIHRRISATEVQHYGELVEQLRPIPVRA